MCDFCSHHFFNWLFKHFLKGRNGGGSLRKGERTDLVLRRRRPSRQSSAHLRLHGHRGAAHTAQRKLTATEGKIIANAITLVLK